MAELLLLPSPRSLVPLAGASMLSGPGGVSSKSSGYSSPAAVVGAASIASGLGTACSNTSDHSSSSAMSLGAADCAVGGPAGGDRAGSGHLGGPGGAGGSG